MNASPYWVRLAGIVACGTLLSLGVRVHDAHATTVGFDGAVQGTFTSYAQGGFAVDAKSPQWEVSGYGNPPPFIQFFADAGEATAATIAVTRSGASLFQFDSVDLYSSVTPIPYLITGSFESSAVFSLSGTVPNTFGGFATVFNSQSTAIIDSLEITLYNNPGPCCSNPMGLDNIVVARVAAVPEASMPVLFGLGLAGLGLTHGLRRRTALGASRGDTHPR